MVKHKIKGVTRPFAVTVCMLVSFVLAGQPAQATVGPGWNNLWVRAACLSKTPNPADVVTSFNVWVPNSPQGDKAFNPPDPASGTYTGYYHYDNIYKTNWGNSYLNYRVYCMYSGVRTGQIQWGGGIGSTYWISIGA